MALVKETQWSEHVFGHTVGIRFWIIGKRRILYTARQQVEKSNLVDFVKSKCL